MKSSNIIVLFSLLFVCSKVSSDSTFYGTDANAGPIEIDFAQSLVTPIYPIEFLHNSISTSGALDNTNGIYYNIFFNLTTDVYYLWATNLKTKKQMYTVRLSFQAKERGFPDQSVVIHPKTGQIFVFGSVCNRARCFNQTLLELNPQTHQLSQVVTLQNYYKPYFYHPIIDPVQQKFVFMAQTGINAGINNVTMWSIDLNSPSTPPSQIVIPFGRFTLSGFMWDAASQTIVGTIDVSDQAFASKEYVAVIDSKSSRFKTTVPLTGIPSFRLESRCLTADGKGVGYKIMTITTVTGTTRWLVSINFTTGVATQTTQTTIQYTLFEYLQYSPQKW